MAEKLTKKNQADLQAYQAAIREWSAREPQGADKYTPQAWADLQAEEGLTEAQKAQRAALQPPENWKELGYSSFVEYSNDQKRWRNTGPTFSQAWEEWNAEGVALNKKYHDVIAKALGVAISMELFKDEPAQVSDIIDRLLSDPVPTSQLLLQRYLPMLNGYPTNDLMTMSSNRMERDGFTHKATFTKGGHTITVNDFSQLVGAIGTSAKKIMDTGVAYLTAFNFYKSDNVNPTVAIDLMDYWRAQRLHVDPLPMVSEEEQRKEQARVSATIKKLKQAVKSDIENLMELAWEGKGTGQNRGDFSKYKFISSYRVRGTTLFLNFDVDIAKYLVHAYQMQWPPALLLHDNRDPNSYAIGRKLALHHSMDSNAIRGTENTLSVESLLKEAPEIVTFEKLTAKGRRDWKKQIKEKLELALNKNITTAPLLKRWEYRDPITGKTYTPETASELPWETYFSLMVDFVMAEEPNQEARRAARAAEKALLQSALEQTQEPVKKKRGRPRKEKTENL